MKQPKYKLFKGVNDEWYFHLCAPNGEIIAQSEGYKERRNALKGISSVRDNAPIATVVELKEVELDKHGRSNDDMTKRMDKSPE